MSPIAIPVVPTFSYSSIISGDAKEALEECVTTIGVFNVRDIPQLSEATHAEARDIAMSFFRNSTQDQRAAAHCADRSIRRGFTDLESESTAKATKAGSYTDYSMCYSMGVENNLFPKDQPEFQRVWESYFATLNETAMNISRAILLSTNSKPEKGIEDFIRSDPLLRFRHFPEVPAHRVAEEEPLRMAAHYDVSNITLINQTPCANGFVSLECEVDGEYVGVPAIKDTVLVRCGAVTTVVSEGKIKAPYHRIVAPEKAQREGSARTSSVFFLRPRADFEFDVRKAKGYGLDVIVPDGRATFGQWIGGNYSAIQESKEVVQN